MIIKRMRSDCMRVMANLGIASSTELDETSEKISFSGIKRTFNPNYREIRVPEVRRPLAKDRFQPRFL